MAKKNKEIYVLKLTKDEVILLANAASDLGDKDKVSASINKKIYELVRQ